MRRRRKVSQKNKRRKGVGEEKKCEYKRARSIPVPRNTVSYFFGIKKKAKGVKAAVKKKISTQR